MVILYVIALMAPALASSTDRLDIASLQHEIDAKGANEVVRNLYARNDAWTNMVRNVQAGKVEWIDIAVRLREGADGGASSELHDALFAALAANPDHVLRVAAPSVSITALCSGRSDPLSTAKAALSEIARIESAVGRVHDKTLKERQRACLVALEDAKANTNRFFKH